MGYFNIGCPAKKKESGAGKTELMNEHFGSVRICAKTDAGLTSGENEDHYLIVDETNDQYDTPSLGRIFAVADGIGGEKAGGTASRMACEGLLDYYAGRSSSGKSADFVESRLQALEQVIRTTNQKIREAARENKEYEGMGTTLSVLVLLRERALLAHVGDSRIYRLRDSRLERLTRDQTMAQLSVEMGYIGQEEADSHPTRHILVEAMGREIDEVETAIEKIEKGDLFLLCTDGLHHAVPDDTIREILEGSGPEGGACDRLVEEAIRRGGTDNITVVVVQT